MAEEPLTWQGFAELWGYRDIRDLPFECKALALLQYDDEAHILDAEDRETLEAYVRDVALELAKEL